MMRLKDVYFSSIIDIKTVFLSCLIFSTSYSLKLTVKNGRYGSGTFIKCVPVTFECVIEPYTNVLSWRYNTKEVAECSFANCQYANDIEGAVFKFDTINGMFQLNIDTVKDKYENMVVECFDGTNTETITVTFGGNGWKSYNFAILITVIIFVNIVAVILTIFFRWKTRSSLGQAIKIFSLPLIYFVVGVLLTVILILVTRFSEDSVVEEYDNICGWEILLILFGIYVFIAICLFVALIVIVLHK